MEKITIHAKCPVCSMWTFLGSVETDNFWSLVSNKTSPFLIDYRKPLGRARGFARIEGLPRNLIPKGFVTKIKMLESKFYEEFLKFYDLTKEDVTKREFLNVVRTSIPLNTFVAKLQIPKNVSRTSLGGVKFVSR